MKGRHRDILAAEIAKTAKRYNHPGKIRIEFFCSNGSSEPKMIGQINMSGREFSKLTGSQLKSIKCDEPKPVVSVKFNDVVKGSVDTLNVELEPEGAAA